MKITTAESQIMDVLWRQGPRTLDEIVDEVAGPQDWGRATVKTLVTRLLKKNALKSEKTDGRHQYRPLVAREDYVTAESQGLLDRLFDGRLAPLISHFANHRDLTPDDVARLKALIEKIDDGR